jgi:hypothetical protein
MTPRWVWPIASLAGTFVVLALGLALAGYDVTTAAGAMIRGSVGSPYEPSRTADP